jgi:hypothetical protein
MNQDAKALQAGIRKFMVCLLVAVEALCYKPEGPGFESRLGT